MKRETYRQNPMQVGMKTTTQSAVTAAVMIVEQTLSSTMYKSGSIRRKQHEKRDETFRNAHLKNIELKTWPSANVRSVSDPSGKLCCDASRNKYGCAHGRRKERKHATRARTHVKAHQPILNTAVFFPSGVVDVSLN